MELISRKDTWREFISKIEDIADLEDIDRILSSMPTIEERKEGYWIRDGHHIRCSECSEYICDTDREGDTIPQNFCPNCGVKMKGECYEVGLDNNTD